MCEPVPVEKACRFRRLGGSISREPIEHRAKVVLLYLRPRDQFASACAPQLRLPAPAPGVITSVPQRVVVCIPCVVQAFSGVLPDRFEKKESLLTEPLHEALVE